MGGVSFGRGFSGRDLFIVGILNGYACCSFSVLCSGSYLAICQGARPYANNHEGLRNVSFAMA